IYFDEAQQPQNGARYAVVANDPLALAPLVRKTLAGLDSTVPLNMMQTYEQYLHDAMTGMISAAVNLAIDAGIALLLARMAASLLYGVHSADVVVFGTTVVAIAGIALLAAYIPARRAALVEPVEALRNEYSQRSAFSGQEI